jgi:hypothetical protein
MYEIIIVDASNSFSGSFYLNRNIKVELGEIYKYADNNRIYSKDKRGNAKVLLPSHVKNIKIIFSVFDQNGNKVEVTISKEVDTNVIIINDSTPVIIKEYRYK